jgi:uncharacterized protein YcgI (DUF1989 family)
MAKTVLDQIIPAGAPWSGIVKKGQHLRIVDREGKQAVDFLCYNAKDREERYFAPNTPLFTIVEDTYGSHDTIGGACSAPSNFMLYSVKDCPGCRENFLKGLAPFNMGRRDIVPNINFFMRVSVQSEGEAAIARGDSAPGTYVELRAEMDTLAVISNCPQINNPANDFNPTPIQIIITEPV